MAYNIGIYFAYDDEFENILAKIIEEIEKQKINLIFLKSLLF
jgi:hypothetical protein